MDRICSGQARRPELRLVRYEPILPLRYWLSGGLRRILKVLCPAYNQYDSLKVLRLISTQ